MELPFTAPAYSSYIPGIGGDDEVNLRLEVSGAGALAVRSLVHTPALRVFTPEDTAGACRAMYTASNGRLFQLAGSEFCEILSTGARTILGTVASSDGIAAMCDNGNELILVDGDTGYLYDFVAATFTQITDAAFPSGCTHLAFIDGYFLAYTPGTLFVRWSLLMDGSTWPELNRASAYSSPDEVVAVAANGRELWAIGPMSTQVFYSTGDADQEFAPVQSVAIDVGTESPHSLAVARDSVLFIGAGKDGYGRVFRSSGYQVAEISTPGIVGILSSATSLSRAVGRVHSFRGHTYYVLTVPEIEKTVVYDVDLGEWHERAWMDPDSGILKRWRGNHSAFAHGRQMVGDSNGSAVYYLSDDHYKDQKPDLSGEWAIKRQRTTPHITAEGKMVQYLDFEVWGRMGEGLVTGHGEDPVVIVEWSNDGGRTWNGTQHVKVGRLGAYDNRARLVLAGQSRDRLFRVVQTDPVPVAWAGARSKVRILPA